MTPAGDEYMAVLRTVPGEFKLMTTTNGMSYETVLTYVVN
jgi:hypothetical protein